MLEIINLTKIYGQGDTSVKALDQVNFKVEEGEMVSIMGPSGSGKSTLMNILGCLDKPTEGEYILDSKPIEILSQDQLADVRNRKIGVVFQSFNLLPRMSALRNVELSMIYSGVKSSEREQRARTALERVGLADRMHHKPNELSGGQRQRVAIARALVNNPAIILADEPTGNLDSKSTQEILKLLRELHSENKTIIIITHEHEVVMATDRVITLRDGKVVSDTEVTHEAV